MNKTIYTLSIALCLFTSCLFTSSFAQGNWTSPVPLGPASNFSDMTILEVEGHPAVCYENYPPGQIMYSRALDPCGETWGTPVNVSSFNPASQFGFNPSMSIVNGRPAISYYAPNTQELIFVRANDVFGNGWSNFKIADTNGNVGQMSELRVVNGHPAISYIDLTTNCNNFLKYVRALDADGNNWGSPITIRELGCGCCQRSKFEIINGHPTLMYRNNGGGGHLEYVRANDPDGNSWPTPMLLGTNKDPNELTVINGLPVALVSLFNIDSLGIQFANDANGSSWGTVDTLNLGTAIQEKASLRILNDSVRVVYSNWSSTASLWYIQSPATQPLLFSNPETITNPVWYGIDSDLETACDNIFSVFTNLGTLYFSIKNTGLCTPPVINAPTAIHANCATPTGSIVVNSNSNRVMEYSVDDGVSFQSSNIFSGLVPGNYNIVVRHKFDPSCETTYSLNPVVINPPPDPPAVSSPTITQPTCSAPTGTIMVNATGNGSLEYSLNNGTSWQSSATFPGLASGSYNIKVRLQADPYCITTYSNNPVVLNLPGEVFTSTDVPKTISASGAPTVTSTLTIPVSGTITDVNVLNLDIDHTYINDLVVKLKSPANTERILLNRICGSQDNILLSLDDESANPYSSIPCPPNGGIYQPYQSLSPFDGQNLEGVWTLTIQDLFSQDGGTLQAWSVAVCYTPVCDTPIVNSLDLIHPTCATPTGTIIVNASGNGTLEYSADDGVTWQSQETFSSLPPNNYNISVRLQSDSTCLASFPGNPATISAVPVLPVLEQLDILQPNCTLPDGTILIAASGTGTLEHSIDSGMIWQTAPIFSGLSPGNYHIFVRLQSDTTCSIPYSDNPVILIAANAPPIVDVPEITQPTCSMPTGTILVNATGNGMLEFSVDDGANWQASETFTGLQPGNYNIWVRLTSEPGCSTAYQGNPVILDEPSGCCPASLAINLSPIPDGIYQAENEINSNGLIPENGNVIFRAWSLVELLPGFEVEPGGIFEIFMQGCVP